MNGYVCFYKGKRIEIYADNRLQARSKVAVMEKVKRKDEYQITVVLAELDGKPVIFMIRLH